LGHWVLLTQPEKTLQLSKQVQPEAMSGKQFHFHSRGFITGLLSLLWLVEGLLLQPSHKTCLAPVLFVEDLQQQPSS
jgi:hypothetical protein